MDNVNKSFQDVLEYVRMYRLKINCYAIWTIIIVKFVITKNGALLLENLDQYIRDDMTIRDVRAIIESMRDDYENRVDDYIIRNAELSKQRREISSKMKSQTKPQGNTPKKA